MKDRVSKYCNYCRKIVVGVAVDKGYFCEECGEQVRDNKEPESKADEKVEQVEHAFVTRADTGDCSVCGRMLADPVHKQVVRAEQRMEDRVRVLRLVEYEGPRAAVERQVENSIHGTRTFHSTWGKRTPIDQPLGAMRITGITLGQYPEVIERAREIVDPSLIQELSDRARRHQERMEKAEAQALEMAEIVQVLRKDHQQSVRDSEAEIERLKLALYQHEDQSRHTVDEI